MDTDWDQLYSQSNVHVAANFLEDSIRAVMDEQALLLKIQPSINYKSWLTAGTKEMMKERERLREIARRSGDQEDWKHYTKVRNKVTKEVTKDRKK